MLRKVKPDKLQRNEEKQRSFDGLKNVLISRPVLRPPDMTKEYILMTDCINVKILTWIKGQDQLADALTRLPV